MTVKFLAKTSIILVLASYISFWLLAGNAYYTPNVEVNPDNGFSQGARMCATSFGYSYPRTAARDFFGLVPVTHGVLIDEIREGENQLRIIVRQHFFFIPIGALDHDCGNGPTVDIW